MREVSAVTLRTDDMEANPIKDGSEVRLLGCQYFIPDTLSTWAPSVANRTVEFLDSAGGTSLFTFLISLSRDGICPSPVVLMLGNAAIRFPSGIHFANIDTTDTGNAGDGQLVVFYEA